MGKENNDLAKVFAKNFNHYLKVCEKTKQDISDLLNIPYRTVLSWATGDSYPRMNKIEALANLFGIRKSDLIEDKDKLIAVHASGVLRASDRCSCGPDCAIPVHGWNTGLQILCNAFNALSLQDAACHGCGNLSFPIRKVNATLNRFFSRIIWHKIRLLHDQPFDCLLVPQVKSHISGYLLNGISSIIAVQTVDSRRDIVNIAYGSLISLGISFRYPFLKRLKTLTPTYLRQSPLFVILFRPFLAVDNSAYFGFHFGITLLKLSEIIINGAL